MTDPTPALPAVDLDALALLAEAASPGPWGRDDAINDHCMITCGTEPDGAHIYVAQAWTETSDAEFIAAANPSCVLSLIQEIRRLRALVEEAFCERRSMQPGPVQYDSEWLMSDARTSLGAP